MKCSALKQTARTGILLLRERRVCWLDLSSGVRGPGSLSIRFGCGTWMKRPKHASKQNSDVIIQRTKKQLKTQTFYHIEIFKRNISVSGKDIRKEFRFPPII